MKKNLYLRNLKSLLLSNLKNSRSLVRKKWGRMIKKTKLILKEAPMEVILRLCLTIALMEKIHHHQPLDGPRSATIGLEVMHATATDSS